MTGVVASGAAAAAAAAAAGVTSSRRMRWSTSRDGSRRTGLLVEQSCVDGGWVGSGYVNVTGTKQLAHRIQKEKYTSK